MKPARRFTHVGSLRLDHPHSRQARSRSETAGTMHPRPALAPSRLRPLITAAQTCTGVTYRQCTLTHQQKQRVGLEK